MLEGSAPAVEALRGRIRHLAVFDAVGGAMVPTLLLQGETGTGKGLVARIVHDSGPRARGPFIPVNCAAIPETMLEAELFGYEAGAFTDARRGKAGLFEAAASGTLFLDEVDSLSLALQSKLLTAIESKRIRRLGSLVEHAVDVKLLAATQHDLGRLAAAGHFRPDLYHRLAVVVLALPPLRQRGDDVVVLARAQLERFAAAYGVARKRLTPDGEAWLRRYPWPGNVRELGHAMERVTLLHSGVEIDAAGLEQLAGSPVSEPQAASAATSARTRADVAEAERLREALARTGGNVLGAARLLGLTRDTVRYRMRRDGVARPRIDAPAAKPAATEAAPPRRLLAGPAEDPAPGARAPLVATTPGDSLAEPTREAWRQAPVVVVAVELTWPIAAEHAPADHEPWTETARWERAIREKLAGLGGVLVQQNPSLVMWAFGIPRALDQLHQRAVHGALAVRHLVAGLTARERTPEMRVAVHSGAMLVDTGSGEGSVRFVPVGETLSVPVRLLAEADPGEVLASAEVARLVDAWVALEPIEVQARSARARSLGAYRVVSVRPSRERGPSRSRRVLTRFVGRERELATLRELLQAAVSGRGQVVGIAGEPGSGKSRLLYEFHQRLGEEGTVYGEGHCLAHGSVTPYLPLVELANAFFEVGESDHDDMVRGRVRSRLGALGADVERHAPYLLRLMGRACDEGEIGRLGQEAIKARTFDAVREVILGVSRRHPVVLALENAHWVDPTSEACLASLVEHVVGARCLVVMTYRPGYRPPWLDKSYASQIALRPLGADESRRLVRAAAGNPGLPSGVEDDLLAKAEGNPFFLEELARAVAHDARAPGDLPDTVQGVLMARIDRLSEGARRVLQTASVLGREFPLRLLTALVDGSQDFTAHLEELARLEFLYSKVGEESLYAFKHALTQEVAYQSLAPPRRAALHAAAGRALEAAHAARPDDAAERLAHHFSHAGERAKAVEYLDRASEKAAGAYAHAEALALLSDALAHAAALPAPGSDRIRLRLTLRRAHSLYFVGRFQESAESLEACAGLLEAAGDPALRGPWHFWLSHIYSRLGRHEDAGENARRAIAEAERCGDAATSGKARGILALEAYWRGLPDEGIAQARQAIALLTSTPDRWWEGMAHFYLSFNLSIASRFAEALEAAARCGAIADAIGDPRLATYGLFTAGWIHAMTGQSAVAGAECREGLRRSPDPVSAAYSSAFLGLALLEGGSSDEATPLLEQAVTDMRRFRFPQFEALFTALTARAYLARGDAQAAAPLAQAALAIAEAAGYRYARGLAQRTLGEVAQAGGMSAAAAAWFQKARDTFAAMGSSFEVARTDLALADPQRRVP